ncbi:FAD-dependent oxidoreductase [Paenibacillus sp.]|uniref:FAD-dependent oxidoreductase n=1 Tax=Paenibacillus sp. TaxID=58172 RepID=UPI0028114DDE|nr:FAD-dependent oxidoreductase [Paenibacillus sp.]
MRATAYDYVIFGAGVFGLYAAKILGTKGLRVALIEFDQAPLQRASFINQARVHNGYHYPRSVSTAEKSASYYARFNQEFNFAINQSFRKIYAISKTDSLTNASQFLKFCKYVNIPATEIQADQYFRKGSVEAAFETLEYSYDAAKIRDWFIEKLNRIPSINISYGMDLMNVVVDGNQYVLNFVNGETLIAPNVLNVTYASTNQILNKFNADFLKIKYEICEVILTKANKELEGKGITMMDGPFFSVMPFGLSGLHSLTSVVDTPHMSSTEALPTFPCQSKNNKCSPMQLMNCSLCESKPNSAFTRMKQLANKYLSDNLSFEYDHSLFAVKTILAEAELDDSRPTVIKRLSTAPNLYTVMSGKFNTIYDLEEALL